MSAGRRASQPDPDWRAPERLVIGTGVLSVRFIEETGQRSKTFDFSDLPVRPGMREWLARAFARQASARSAVKRVNSADGHHFIIGIFAASLAASHPQIDTPHDLTAADFRAFQDRYANRRVQHAYVKRLRTLLRDDPDLPATARAALLGVRLPAKPEPNRLAAYSDSDWQSIMTAVRGDVRVARDRIRAGRAVLERFRAGDAADHEAEIGRWLDLLDRSGDLPRVPSGDHIGRVRRAGGLRQLGLQLCLSQQEATAFCLLLTALTAENFGTVATWPAAHYRPDGTHGQTGIALLEETKPRRGPERQHMIASLEDLPAGLGDVLDDADADRRLFRSPLRIYLLLIELTELARRHGGHTQAVAPFIASPGRRGQRWSAGANAADVVAWARSHGFPAANAGQLDGKPGDSRGAHPADRDRAPSPSGGAHAADYERRLPQAQPHRRGRQPCRRRGSAARPS